MTPKSECFETTWMFIIIIIIIIIITIINGTIYL